MNHDRDALITAYRMRNNCTQTEADRIVRGVELAYAEQQNAELLKALDEADGQHLKDTQELRSSNVVLRRMLEAFPQSHMRFGVIGDKGETEILPCADWCYACKMDELAGLREENANLKKRLGID